MTAPASITIPSFDLESPDSEILEAVEMIRSHRAWLYDHDPLHKIDPAAWEAAVDSPEAKAKDDEAERAETMLLRNWATTPSGVAAQLAFAITVECDRWVDHAFAADGFLALYNQSKELDGREQIVVTACYELLHMEWEQALADWRASGVIFSSALEINDLVSRELYRHREAGTEPSEFLQELAIKTKALEDDTTNNAHLNRLVRTLAPDFASYKLKAEIAMSELITEFAGPWLVRDVNFLMGATVSRKTADEDQAEAA